MTPALLLVLLCSLLGCIVRVQGKSFVSVHIPFQLHNHSGEEHATAEFGFQQQHQGSMAAYVYLVDSTLCGKRGNKTRYLYPSIDDGNLKKSPYMIMALGGGDCSAVTKARNAQRDGASGLIVAHQDCRCSDRECTDAYGPECVNETEEIMVNDGSAGDVSIPSLLLYKTVANKIMDELKKDQPVLIEFNWGLKNNDAVDAVATVPFNLWTTAHDPILDLETYRNFQTVALALEPQAKFEPRFSLVPGSRFHCNKEVDTSGPCDHLCTNHGRYCALHADNLSGHAIVAETLRRLCIWKEYGTGTDEGAPQGSGTYWNYLLYHVEHCSGPHLYNDTECIQNAYTAANIVDTGILTQCMEDTGGLDDDVPNTLMEKELLLQDRSSVVALPALTIGPYVLEQASSWHLFEGLCRYFYTRNLTTTPDICFQCSACANVIGCIEAGGTCVEFKKPTVAPASKGDSGGNNKKKHGHGWKVFWFFFIVAGLGGGYLYYKRRQDNEGSYRGGGGGILSGYFQLAGEE